MYLYHGSTMPPGVVLKEGLKPLEPGERIEEVLSEFAFKGEIPDQVVTYIGYELCYRDHQRSDLDAEALSVHLTASRKQAELYGRRKGGEFADNVRWACKRFYADTGKEKTRTFVYVIDTGDWEPEQVTETKRRCHESDLAFDDIVEIGSWDITLTHVAPEQIANWYCVGGPDENTTN